MANRSSDRKISEFPALTSIPSSSIMSFVSGGANYKITYANFTSSLGVTGSIVQSGNIAGTPVLDVQGAVNNIRTLENGSGVKASVSAENGITLEHNFTFDSTGVPISVDPSAFNPTVRSLIAGSGITVSGSGDTIQISSTGIPASTKTVIVNQLSDFPAASGGIITLADNTEYLVRNDISIGTDVFLVGDNCVIRGADILVTTITYTGAAYMFTGIDSGFTMSSINLDCSTTGSCFNFSNAASNKRLTFNDISVRDCLTALNINGSSIVDLDHCLFEFSVMGINLAGAISSFNMKQTVGIGSAGVAVDVSGSVLGSYTDTDSLYNLSGATLFMVGDVASANITSLATVLNTRLIPAGAILTGITETDTKWQFFFNDEIHDTRTDALLSMQANATNTVIAITGTPVKVAGTWVVEEVSQMSGSTGGTVTLDTTKDSKLPISVSVTVAAISGGTKLMAAYVAINGVVVANSKRTASAASSQPALIAIPWQATLNPSDTIEVWVANDSDTIDVLVSSAVLRIN